jgi:adenylate kinase family enzyme
MEELAKLDRVVVVGTSCAGKTTFGRQLAAIMNAPVIELDSLYWGPNWTPVPVEQFRAATDAATAGQRWVCDGNYAMVRDITWRRATALVWLNFRFRVVFTRALRRTVGRCVTRAELFAGNRESFRLSFLCKDSILWWVITTHRRRQREYAELIRRAEWAHLTVVELRTPADARAFLDKTADGTRRVDQLSEA